MPFEKGMQKTGGIVKGQKQQKTLDWENFGKELLEYGMPRVRKILEEAPDEQFMNYLERYLEYFRPKLARMEIQADINVKTVTETTIFQIKPKE